MQQAARQSETDADVTAQMLDVANAACEASRVMACATTTQKDRALRGIAARIRESRGAILDANKTDLEAAVGLDAALVDRLELDAARLEAMAAGVRGRSATRSDRLDRGFKLPSERYTGWSHACAARRYRHHLRIETQCDG